MKAILITGVNKGLGQALLNQFVEKGYFVFGLLRNIEIYNLLNLNKPENVEYILADVSDDACIDKIRQTIENRKIDLVINNAGIGGSSFNLEGAESEEIATLFNIHCLGVLRVMKAVQKKLSKDSVVLNINSRFGSITNQSIGTFKELEVSYSYRIAKASQNMLTACLRLEFENIKFVSLTPGKLKTALAQSDANLTPEESAKKIIEFWEQGSFQNFAGIFEVPNEIMEW